MPKLGRSGGKQDRLPRRDFAERVSSGRPSEKPLPITHMTDAYFFRQILETSTLQPLPRNVFKQEPLLYFFYGRPAYRAAVQAQSNGLDAYAPICFILKPEAAQPHRIFPFDSGAFHTERYTAFTHHQMMKEDFELECDLDMPGRLVNLFWPSEKSYFDNKEPHGINPEPMEFEAKSYQELIRFKGKGEFDERASSIEIQTAEPFALPDNTIAVILPEDFAQGKILAKIEEMGALALPYNHMERGTAQENTALIYSIVRELFSGKHQADKGKKAQYW